jgi:MFS family permease
MRLGTRGATTAGAWYIVGVFAALLAMSYFDRFILALLANPISQDLTLTDRQMGLLLGFGFALVYSIAGLPIAWYLDRGNRVRGVVVGALIWSVGTMASAFADTYAQLLVLRAGVAVGEAVLTPAMVSLIADLFEPGERARPTAIYLVIGTLMSGGAFIAGGFAVDLAELIHGVMTDWPVWRITLFMVGVPGIFLALLLFTTVREPGRRPAVAAMVDDPHPWDTATFTSHLRGHADFYLPFYICVGFGVSLGFAGFSWVPTILVRAYGFEVADSGYTFGMAAVPAIAAGTLFWSWLAGRIGPLFTMLLGVAVTLAAGLGALAWDGSTSTVVAAALICGGAGCFTPVCALIVQHVTPPQLHARLMAMALLAASLFGSGLGPLAPPLIAGFWGDDPMALRHAVFAYALGVGAVLLAGLLVGLRGYERLVQGRPGIAGRMLA